jgi:hypothetical protein
MSFSSQLKDSSAGIESSSRVSERSAPYADKVSRMS